MIPAEPVMDKADAVATAQLEALKANAKRRGIWALGHPADIGGGGRTFMETALLNEVIGGHSTARRPWAPGRCRTRSCSGRTPALSSGTGGSSRWWSAHVQEVAKPLIRLRVNVLDAAQRAGARRTVLIDSQSIIDPAFTQTELSPVIAISELDSARVRSKRAMYCAAMHRTALGQDVIVVTPGVIYGRAVS